MALDLAFAPFSGVGTVNFFERDSATGAVGGGFDLGEAPAFTIGNKAPSVEMNTSRDTSRGVAYRMAQSKGADLNIDLQTLTDFNLGLLTSGSWSDVAAVTNATNWQAPNGLVVGQVIKLPAEYVTDVTVTDSTGSPKTLPPEQYELDAAGGTITLKDIATGGPYVQPFKGTYKRSAQKVLGALKTTDKEFTVQLNGTNAYDGSRVICQVYRFRFAAEGDVALKGTDFGTFQLKGSILIDNTKVATGPGGQYYKLIKPAA